MYIYVVSPTWWIVDVHPLLVRQTAFNFSFVHSVSFYIDLGNWWVACWSNRMCRALQATDWYMNSFIGFYLFCLFGCVIFFLFQSGLKLHGQVFKYEWITGINCQTFSILAYEYEIHMDAFIYRYINNICTFICILISICICTHNGNWTDLSYG